jgi:hypothetical protein
VSCDNCSETWWSFETKDGQRNRDKWYSNVREIQPDQVAKVVMSIGKYGSGENPHRLRMLEFYGFDGQRIGDAFGYKDDTDKKIEFELKKGDRLIGYKKSDRWNGCVDFQFIIGRK